MKTLLSLLSLVCILSACRKDRVCTCTDESGNTVSQATYTHVTRKEAKANCVSSAGVTCTVK